jgi:hypothetical protein
MGLLSIREGGWRGPVTCGARDAAGGLVQGLPAGGWLPASRRACVPPAGIGSVGNPYMVDGVQKVVLRLPFKCLATPQPLHKMPLPLGVAKLLAGLFCRGWLGFFSCLLFGLK